MTPAAAVKTMVALNGREVKIVHNSSSEALARGLFDFDEGTQYVAVWITPGTTEDDLHLAVQCAHDSITEAD